AHAPRAYVQPARERRLLFEALQGGPEGFLHPVGLVFVECEARICVADATPETELLTVFELPQDTAAVRAAERRRLADFFIVLENLGIELGDRGLLLQRVADEIGRRHGRRFTELRQQLA